MSRVADKRRDVDACGERRPLWKIKPRILNANQVRVTPLSAKNYRTVNESLWISSERVSQLDEPAECVCESHLRDRVRVHFE